MLGSRAIEDLVDLPLMQDAESLRNARHAHRADVPAMYIDENLVALNICRAVNLSLERGNSDAAPISYAAMGVIASARFGHHEKGYRLARMACDLVERRGLKHFGGMTYLRSRPWFRGPDRSGTASIRRAGPSRCRKSTASRHMLQPLAAYSLPCFLLSGIHSTKSSARSSRFGIRAPVRILPGQNSSPLALVRMLRGKTAKFGSLDDGQFMERIFEERMTGLPAFAMLECYYWIRKLQARFFGGDYAVGSRGRRKGRDGTRLPPRWHCT